MVGTPTNVKTEWSGELFVRRRNSFIDKPCSALRTFRCFMHRYGLFCSMNKLYKKIVMFLAFQFSSMREAWDKPLLMAQVCCHGYQILPLSQKECHSSFVLSQTLFGKVYIEEYQHLLHHIGTL
uniref:Uncharacterized protein n=1 Tax=Setaria viridis TaxID=4556 RepID=A0A4U6T988_SETVI|nr:hypothetical protein SEVIR_9G470700v2 [Setaria viridis]